MVWFLAKLQFTICSDFKFCMGRLAQCYPSKIKPLAGSFYPCSKLGVKRRSQIPRKLAHLVETLVGECSRMPSKFCGSM
jgi:hypothetical protein